jgi:hypothetical protein
LKAYWTFFSLRFNHPDNILSTFIVLKCVADNRILWKFRYIATFDGAPHTICLTRHTNSVRWVLLFLLLLLSFWPKAG